MALLVGCGLAAVIAPARAQWPQPSSSELFGSFECRMATAPTCLCSQDNDRNEIVYQSLLEAVASHPVRAGGDANRQMMLRKWRRQCGLLEQADTTP